MMPSTPSRALAPMLLIHTHIITHTHTHTHIHHPNHSSRPIHFSSGTPSRLPTQIRHTTPSSSSSRIAGTRTKNRIAPRAAPAERYEAAPCPRNSPATKYEIG